MSICYVIGQSFDKTHFTCIWVDLGHVSRFKKLFQPHGSTASSTNARQLLFVEVYKNRISDLFFFGSIDVTLGLLFS